MRTLVVCTIYGPVMRMFKVQRWYCVEGIGVNVMRDDRWELVRLERRHVGVYAE
jgi:hypothetical protein